MKIIYKLILSLLCLLSASAAIAAGSAAADIPPNLEPLNENTEPALTTNKPVHSDSVTTKTIQNGPNTEVIVNSAGSTYTVKPNQNSGNIIPGEVQSSSNHPAQWNIFSWGKAKPAETNDTPPAAPSQR